MMQKKMKKNDIVGILLGKWSKSVGSQQSTVSKKVNSNQTIITRFLSDLCAFFAIFA